MSTKFDIFNAIFDINQVKQFWNRCDFIGLFGNSDFTERELVFRNKRTDNVKCFMFFILTATDCLAINCNGTALLMFRFESFIQT